jgi:hypothetical protein
MSNELDAAIEKHRRALSTRDSIEGWGPDYDAALQASLDALQELVETPCGNEELFLKKMRYLDGHASMVDQSDGEYCCVNDAVSAYLVH